MTDQPKGSFLQRASDLLMVDFVSDNCIESEALLVQAFAHPSLKAGKNYERLEFLGDRVLSLVVAHWLYELYPNKKEGYLSITSARLVSKKTLLQVATKLNIKTLLDDKLLLVMDERALNSTLVNCLEALLGVVYLTKGMDCIEQFIKQHWQEFLVEDNSIINNPRGQLQEWLQARQLPLPRYRVVATGGLDHAPTFTIELEIPLPQVKTIITSAPTKKLAVTQAAIEAIKIIGEMKL